MKNLIDTAEIQSQSEMDDVQGMSARITVGPGAANVRVQDPLAVGIEEFKRAFRFGPSRPYFKTQDADKNQNRKNDNANNIIAKQTVHWQSGSVHLPSSDSTAGVIGRQL